MKTTTPPDNIPPYEFVVDSKRWKHSDTYELWLMPDGWYVLHIAIEGQCDKSGHPYLFEAFEQDSIKYPDTVGELMSELFDNAIVQTMTRDTIQQRLEQIALTLPKFKRR